MAKYGGLNRIKQLEEAAGIETPVPPAPVVPPPVGTQKTGFVAAPWTGPRPWAGDVVPPPAPVGRRSSLLSQAAEYLPSSRKAIAAGRGLANRAVDYLGGKDIFNRARPTATGMTGRALLAPPTVMSSQLTPLDTLRRRSVRGSKPFSESEIKTGYRKMGKGLKGK